MVVADDNLHEELYYKNVGIGVNSDDGDISWARG